MCDQISDFFIPSHELFCYVVGAPLIGRAAWSHVRPFGAFVEFVAAVFGSRLDFSTVLLLTRIDLARWGLRNSASRGCSRGGRDAATAQVARGLCFRDSVTPSLLAGRRWHCLGPSIFFSGTAFFAGRVIAHPGWLKLALRVATCLGSTNSRNDRLHRLMRTVLLSLPC
jgi:hypothetical protein